VHTNLSDGAHSPEEMLDMYGACGFDFVALTDHEYLVRNKNCGHIPDVYGDMLVFKGVELEPVELMHHHVLDIPGEELTLKVLCHPDSYHLTIEEVLHRIETSPWPIDAVEITAQGFYTPEYDTPRIPIPKVATDDAHVEWAVGRAWVEVEARKSKDEILKAIKHGTFRNVFR